MATGFGTAKPYIASYVILRRGDTVALVLRQHTKWMNGYWGLPSGKVERKESFSAAAIREAKEEVGVDITETDLRYVLTVQRMEPDSMWIDIIFEADSWVGEPYNAEPDVHGEMEWFELTKLPKNIVPSVRFMLEQIKAGKTYAEYGW